MKPINEIVSRKEVKKTENITAVNDELKINGKIDEPIIQGNVGSCWLLAGINSLNSTENGKQIIRNSIIPNDDGTVTIKFAGVGRQITLTADEIKEHDTDTNISDNYSNGDNDALVMEIAMQKLIEKNPKLIPGLDKGISGGHNFHLWQALIPNNNITHIMKFSIKRNSSGIPLEAKENVLFKDKIKDIFNEALTNKNIVMGFAMPGHALAITEVSENKVTYVDSMNDSEKTVSWDDFIDNYALDFTYTDLSKIQ